MRKGIGPQFSISDLQINRIMTMFRSGHQACLSRDCNMFSSPAKNKEIKILNMCLQHEEHFQMRFYTTILISSMKGFGGFSIYFFCCHFSFVNLVKLN